MSAKERILQALQSDTPPAEPWQSRVETFAPDDLLTSFTTAWEGAGGEVLWLGEASKEAIALALGATTKKVVDTRHEKIDEIAPEGLWAIVEGVFGVAENGAVWIEPKERYPRALLTLAEHVVVVLEKRRLVPTMAQAYRKVDFSTLSYGLFLAGPSKTADIEQSLVIGAHGALKCTAVLV
ncbi:MAG: hypothetical protein GXO33_02755 [Epsilonproteobacteria bacterium]|nr:hypothetical protein [Campylobacterota bacterium]